MRLLYIYAMPPFLRIVLVMKRRKTLLYWARMAYPHFLPQRLMLKMQSALQSKSVALDLTQRFQTYQSDPIRYNISVSEKNDKHSISMKTFCDNWSQTQGDQIDEWAEDVCGMCYATLSIFIGNPYTSLLASFCIRFSTVLLNSSTSSPPCLIALAIVGQSHRTPSLLPLCASFTLIHAASG